MCGILGFFAKPGSGFPPGRVEPVVSRLFVLSESRGKEAAGVAVCGVRDITVLKQATAASQMVKTKTYRKMLELGGDGRSLSRPVAIIGHSRLVTNGSMSTSQNNQPVIAAGMVGIHNGIIANVDELWAAHPALQRQSEVDTEVLFALIRHFLGETGSLVEAVQAAFSQIEGVANIAVFLKDFGQMLLATNNGSLYLCENKDASVRLFSSERYIMERLVEEAELEQLAGPVTITQITAGQACLLDLEDLTRQDFSLSPQAGSAKPAEKRGGARDIVELEGVLPSAADLTILAPASGAVAPRWFIEEFERNAAAIAGLKRCTKCVHPETLPYVDLDAEGVCAYCRHPEPLKFLGHDALEALVAPYRRKDGQPDCIVPLSGGRDSCYALHYVKTKLKMNPIAYTYDWGMVTDLARRNCARMCGKLGVEHILISANIAQKRRFIRKNVEAWLRRPDLGTVPLFMAGDKQFFYYAEQLKKQVGTKLLMFSMNPLERTDFKHGFCGISGGGHEGSFFRLSPLKNMQIALYYAKAYLMNPAYINSSVPDTLFAYFSYYLMSHEYQWFYDYIRWDEETVSDTLINEYNWERAPDTKGTWRIGDGTASFYNYIYHTVAGFSEYDTFRSFQIREGMMTRETALAHILEENRPRYESMAWYCETIGVDLEKCIRTINGIPKLYPH